MRFDREIITTRLAPHVQILTPGDALVFGATLIMLAVLMSLPLITGDRLPDFRPLETQERKDQFFAFLDPILDEVNSDVTEERLFIESVAAQLTAGESPSWLERRKIRRLAQYYEVTTTDADLGSEVLPELQMRVDTVPRSLVFVQAAKESGWGTSRFALEGNNLFGQRCYSAGCGMLPAGVKPDANFGVARFGTVNASVASYVRNLNTHPQYAGFRTQRRDLRRRAEVPTGVLLADSLIDYSERGIEYVEEIKALIRQNSLEGHD
ncbi:MAG: glucosaminidase domain-containing protein [Candidatus Rariloculaceae bacterium]